MAFDSTAAWDDPQLRSRFGAAAERRGSAFSYLGAGESNQSFVKPLGSTAKAFRGTGGQENQAAFDQGLSQAATTWRDDLTAANNNLVAADRLGAQAVSAVQKARHAQELAKVQSSGGSSGLGTLLDGMQSIAGFANKAGWIGGGGSGSVFAGNTLKSR